MKKSQGVSLISLVITIVVIIILAGISIYYGVTKNIGEAENTMDYNEIFAVSEAVAQRALLSKLNPNGYKKIGKEGDYNVTIEQYSDGELVEVTKNFNSLEGWVMIDEDNSEELNLERIRRNYLVNYETNEVVSLTPIKYNNKVYYMASELRDALSGGETMISSDRYDEAKGINKPYIVSGMVPVKRSGNSWIVTNADDTKWYDYAGPDATGTQGNLWANVMLTDELSVIGMNNAEVRKSTLNQLDGKTVVTEGSMYVWVPRYSRGLIDGERKIVYSKLTEDYFPDANDTNNVLNAFEENGVQLTGIWVSKYDAGYIEK